MRADEPIKYGGDIVEYLVDNSPLNYINQLWYERLMAKAEKFKALNWAYCMQGFAHKCKQCKHIAKAYEARARRIKEGM